MTGTEVLALILIIALFLAFALIFYAIIRAGTRGTVSWIGICIAGIIGLLLIVYLLANIDNIEPANWAQIIVTTGLLVVTSMYAWSTQKQAKANETMAEEMKGQAQAAQKQAEASVKMAEEMRNAQSPSITIQWGAADSNNKNISAHIKNVGSGPALNLKCYLTHKTFVFKGKFDGYTTFMVGQDYTLTLKSENFDFAAWDGLSINCDYASILGDKFRSILRHESKDNRSFERIKLNSGDRND